MLERFMTVRFAAGLFFLIISAQSASAKAGSPANRDKPVLANQAIPTRDFFRPRFLSDPQLSPDGEYLAGITASGKDRTALLVGDLKTGKFKNLIGEMNEDTYSFRWLDNEHILYTLTQNKIYAKGLMVADIRHLDQSYPLMQDSAISIVGVPHDKKHQVLIWVREDAFDDGRDGGVVALDWSLNLGPLEAKVHSAGSYQRIRQLNYGHIATSLDGPKGELAAGYMCDKNGDLAYSVAGKNGLFHLYRYHDEHWRKTPINLDHVTLFSYGNRPDQVVVKVERGWIKPAALAFMDTRTGKPGKVILQEKNYDPNCSLVRDRVTKQIIGVSYETTGPQMVWFSPQYQSLQSMLEKNFPGLVVRIIDSDDDRNRFLVSTFSDRQPEVFYELDLKKKRLEKIAASRPWIDPSRMRPMSVLKFKTKDGHLLDAYVTLPAGASKNHPVPLVVLPHGGPWVRDSWGFDSRAQFLASRGFAVLQPNYRGSIGYTWMFGQDELWDFRKMSDDVADATRAVLSTGLVDPKRVAIVGGSFGGYLAVAGAAFQHGLYRCAVTIDGVFDWAKMIKESRFSDYRRTEFGTLKRWLGDPAKEKAKFVAISPLHHIDQVKIPVFVVHGKEDPVVDVEQSVDLIRQLKKFNVPYEEMLVANEGHGMSALKDKVKLYDRIVVFLRKNLGIDAVPSKAK